MNTKTFSNELADHREALSNLATQIETLASQLDDLKSEMDDEVISADELIEADSKRQEDRRVFSSHYRMLAILNEYGAMHREHVAKLLGVQDQTIMQMLHVCRHRGLAELKTSRGVVSLQSLADGVSENKHFTI
jgi:ABC-type transporter Mla subunit MlaD